MFHPHFGYIPSVLRICLVNVPSLFCLCSIYVPTMFRLCSVYVWSMVYFLSMLRICLCPCPCSVCVPSMFRQCSITVPSMFCLCSVFIVFRLCFSYALAIFRMQTTFVLTKEKQRVMASLKTKDDLSMRISDQMNDGQVWLGQQISHLKHFIHWLKITKKPIVPNPTSHPNVFLMVLRNVDQIMNIYWFSSTNL